MRPTIAVQSRLMSFRLAYLFAEPQRFDVVVFRFPDNESVLYVKRILGLPGEQVDIVDGVLYIDGIHIHEWYLLETPNAENYTFIVPEDSFFVLGDNRNDSHDSRTWINTFLPRENILGRTIFAYFPSFRMIR